MADYKIYFKKSVEKDLALVPTKVVHKIMQRIGVLCENPRPSGCEKITGQNRYRLRQGRDRILYSILDQELTITVVKIAHRESGGR